MLKQSGALSQLEIQIRTLPALSDVTKELRGVAQGGWA